MPAKALSGEGGQQPEVGQFHLACGLCAQFGVAGGGPSHPGDPGFDANMGYASRGDLTKQISHETMDNLWPADQ
jgi:hypothetical protein